MRQTESLVRVLKNGKKTSYNSKDPNTLSTQNSLAEKIGMSVVLNNKKNNSGSLTIQYKGLEQLDRLVKIIKENY